MRPNLPKKYQPIPLKPPQSKPLQKRYSQQQQIPQNQMHLLPFSALQQQYRRIKNQTLKIQAQQMNKQKLYRIQVFKNQKLKDQIQDVDKQFQINKRKMALEMLQKNKDNKESPMFYNENGLCPFELLLINQKRVQPGVEGFVCMICFQDIEENQQIIQLPCDHTFHKQCGVQQLLGSKFCPNCSQVVDTIEYSKKIIENQGNKY